MLSGRGEKTSVGSSPRRPYLFLFAAITLPVIVLDQLTKLFVQAHMALYESIAIIPNYLDITYTLNPGAAFSMLADAPAWSSQSVFALDGGRGDYSAGRF